MGEFKAAIFDLDGTVLDTLEDLADSVNAVLHRHGWPVHPLEAYRWFVGDGLAVLVERALPERAAEDAASVDMVVAEFDQEYARRWNAKTRPYSGIPALLDRLVEDGLKLAVLSNKPHRFTRQCVTGFLGRWPWAVVMGHQDGKPKKPDPSGAHDAARLMRVRPVDCVYFGDTGVDMETARGAGMYAVGVLWGFRDEQELRGAGAHVVIRTPAEFFAAGLRR